MAGTISRLLGKDQPGVDSCQHCGGKMPATNEHTMVGDYQGEGGSGDEGAMPARPATPAKGGGPGQKATKRGSASQGVKDNSSPRAGGPSGGETASGGAGGGDPKESASKMPGNVGSANHIDSAGGGSSKRGAKTATETPQADGQTKPSQGGGMGGEDAVWQPKSTWEHGWGSESEPDNSNSGDDGDEPDELEKD